MRALVTGATGFAGRWLVRELESAGHEVVATPPSSELDIADTAAVRELVARTGPDVIAHLASASSGAMLTADPIGAIRSMVGGTRTVVDAALALDPRPGLLLVSSGEVYGGSPTDRPIREGDPVQPRGPYGHLKVAQETIARLAAVEGGLRVTIARPFNHAGPDQRPSAVVPAFAARVIAVRDGRADAVTVGNVDVERDITDVRDVAVAYRLLLERLADAAPGEPALTVNVASGRGVRLRAMLEELCRLAGVAPRIDVDPALVRADDPSRVVGDASVLRELTGWEARIPLSETLADVLDRSGHA